MLRISVIALAIVVASSAEGDAWTSHIDPKWSESPFFDSGKAEILSFRTTEIREGHPRIGESRMILVKEDHLPSQGVKANDPKAPGALARIKFNHLLTIPVGVATYRQMLSIYFDRNTLAAPKTVFSSQEWCGQTFKLLEIKNNSALLDYTTYWEGESHGREEVSAPPGTVPYNSLPVLLRALRMDTKTKLEIPIFLDLVSVRKGEVGVTSATVTLRQNQPVPSHRETRGVEAIVTWGVKGKSHEDRFWFSKEMLHPLLRWEKYDGAVYELIRRDEDAYWRHNRPGDETRLK